MASSLFSQFTSQKETHRFDELLHVPGSVRQRGPGAQEEGGEPLQDPVVAVAVDDVHPSPPPSDVDVPGI